MGEKSKKILLTILILVVLGVLLFFFVFSYGSPIKFNATGGTITNTSGDAIVYSDQRTDATNGLGITYYVNGATVNGTIGNYTTNSVLM